MRRLKSGLERARSEFASVLTMRERALGLLVLALDVGYGHFDSNLRVRDLDRDSLDVNLHYFMDAHTEIVLNTRLEMLAFGNGGRSGGYSLIQLHYRL